jgi:hypothetical protein
MRYVLGNIPSSRPVKQVVDMGDGLKMKWIFICSTLIFCDLRGFLYVTLALVTVLIHNLFKEWKDVM